MEANILFESLGLRLRQDFRVQRYVSYLYVLGTFFSPLFTRCLQSFYLRQKFPNFKQ